MFVRTPNAILLFFILPIQAICLLGAVDCSLSSTFSFPETCLLARLIAGGLLAFDSNPAKITAKNVCASGHQRGITGSVDFRSMEVKSTGDEETYH